MGSVCCSTTWPGEVRAALAHAAKAVADDGDRPMPTVYDDSVAGRRRPRCASRPTWSSTPTVGKVPADVMADRRGRRG